MGQVHFKTAARQVIRFVAVAENPGEDIIQEIESTDKKLDHKECKLLMDLESRTPIGLHAGNTHLEERDENERWTRMEEPLCVQIASLKLQRMYRDRKVWRSRVIGNSQPSAKEEELVLTPPVA